MLSAPRLHALMRISGLLTRRDDALNASLTWRRHVSAMHWLVPVWRAVTPPTDAWEAQRGAPTPLLAAPVGRLADRPRNSSRRWASLTRRNSVASSSTERDAIAIPARG